MASDAIWKPGSFTKNFSWGDPRDGLLRLHENIRIGFANKLVDVPRSLYRERVASTGRPDHIPVNFFLFNKITGDKNYLVADELVFQALCAEHSPRFDKLAIFALNFSHAGKWRGQDREQRYPALWAQEYIRVRVAQDFSWNANRITPHDIEKYIIEDRRYQAQGAKKLSTNLAYIYSVGKLNEMNLPQVERWWVDAIFLALDRLIEDNQIDGQQIRERQYNSVLNSSEFSSISGQQSLEKELAMKHVCRLFSACGGRERFSEERVRELVARLHREDELAMANDDRPRGAVYPTNPRILKNIPWACAPLAHAAGFVVLDPDQMAIFDEEAFVRERTRTALAALQADGVKPEMTAEDVMKITRER